jgi:hypothetical protein
MAKAMVVVFAVMSMWFVAGCSSSGGNSESGTVSPASADLLTGQSVQFQTTISAKGGNLIWSVNGTANGNASVGTIDGTGLYAAPATQPSAPVTVTVSNSTRPSRVASASVTVIAPGQVTSTVHPLVALYTIAPSVNATVAIQFGTDTSYGLTTWTQPAAGNAAPLGMLVAGMRANTLYHMRAVLHMPDGSQLNDNDHTFTTGALPAAQSNLTITVTNPNGMVPQSGVEMLDMINVALQVEATDMQGNIVWWYIPKGSGDEIVQPIKLMPNGHMIVVFSPSSATPLTGPTPPPGTFDVVREIDLTGTTIREISIDDLNTRLAAAGMNYTAGVFHHDVAVLPNGHWIVLVNSVKNFTDLTGFPGTTTVLGDALIDLDTNLKPVWLWNEFDHLDVNRHPMNFPDWTHSNAVLYSPTDGNLLVSIRHQNWIVKIDYADGKGAGDILWHLGEGGDFTLQGGVDPTDWFYAEHGPSFVTQTTAGKFGLTVFDNGNDRTFPNNENCVQAGEPTCPYSSAMVLNIDETAKTATFAFHDAPSIFSVFGGNAEQLANGNIEFDLCSVPVSSARVMEVTPTSPSQTVWQLDVNKNAYRAFRMGSLYPGVQW